MTLDELQTLCATHMTMGQPAGNVEVKGLMANDLNMWSNRVVRLEAVAEAARPLLEYDDSDYHGEAMQKTKLEAALKALDGEEAP